MLDALKQYFADTSVYMIVDMAVCLLLYMLIFSFLLSRKSIKLFFIFLAYGVVVLALRLFYTRLPVLNYLINYINIFVIVIFCLVYQNDFKSIISRFGRKAINSHFHNTYSNTDEDLSHATQEIVRAVQSMSKNDVGALIVIVPTSLPDHILATGTMLNSMLSCALLESIFNTHSPLHDGAVIVSGNCLVAAGCFLPLSQDVNIDKELGTRHRAAIGITEQSDVLTIVVSEETGIISSVYNGEIKRYLTPEKLTNIIQSIYGVTK